MTTKWLMQFSKYIEWVNMYLSGKIYICLGCEREYQEGRNYNRLAKASIRKNTNGDGKHKKSFTKAHIPISFNCQTQDNNSVLSPTSQHLTEPGAWHLSRCLLDHDRDSRTRRMVISPDFWPALYILKSVLTVIVLFFLLNNPVKKVGRVLLSLSDKWATCYLASKETLNSN